MLPATKNLIATAQDPARKPTDVDAAAKQFFEAVAKSPKSEAEAQMAALAEHYDLPDYHRGAFLALVCGALVERGCDPQPMAAPLRVKLKKLLEAAARLVAACKARMPEEAADEDDESDDDDDGSEPVNEAFEEARRQVAATMPNENAAWEALGTFWRPGIAVYSKSDLARMAARGLRPLAQQIAEFHQGGHWLQLILSVLDDEPILVIEPETNTGVLARIAGVVDNFQLHVLLMDAFPQSGIAGVRRVPLHVAEIARGNGPQEGGEEDIVTGYWNLYTWQALQANGQLPPGGEFSSSTHWIWNEGLPEDIPQFEGRRVVLLGQPSFERTWRAMRMFDFLPAKLTIERKLTTAEVSEWLQKMVAAKPAAESS